LFGYNNIYCFAKKPIFIKPGGLGRLRFEDKQDQPGDGGEGESEEEEAADKGDMENRGEKEDKRTDNTRETFHPGGVMACVVTAACHPRGGETKEAQGGGLAKESPWEGDSFQKNAGEEDKCAT